MIILLSILMTADFGFYSFLKQINAV